MIEQVFPFGLRENLLGVLTEPDAGQLRSDSPALLFLNAGVLHHVGPFDWYKTLARRLAGCGLRSFRFDLAGIGESAGRADCASPLDGARFDVAEAMDFLSRKRKVRRFVLFGLCSGAVLAHHVAVRDERVAGAVLIDGVGYRTTGYYLRHYGARAFRWQPWLGGIRRLVRVMRRGVKQAETPLLSESCFFEFPPREQTVAELTLLLQRGVSLLFLYTGGVTAHYFNHHRQFEEMFGRLNAKSDKLKVEYASIADHLYSAHQHRENLFALVESWIKPFLETKDHGVACVG
jgi:pimeloyl-ACP methyl ester carboxylesterase